MTPNIKYTFFFILIAMKQRTKRTLLIVSAITLGIIAIGSVMYNVYLNSSIQGILNEPALAGDEYRVKVVNSFDGKIVDDDMYNLTLYSTVKDDYDSDSIILTDIKKADVTLTTVKDLDASTIYTLTEANIAHQFYYVELYSTYFFNESAMVVLGTEIVFSVTNYSTDIAMTIISNEGASVVNGTEDHEWFVSLYCLNDSEGTGVMKPILGVKNTFVPSVGQFGLVLRLEFNETASLLDISEKPAGYNTEYSFTQANSAYLFVPIDFHGSTSLSFKLDAGLGTDYVLESVSVGYGLDTTAFTELDICV